MKELSIEEKAKRYDEALEIARQIYDADRVSGIELTTCEEIFPELKESEDERIRKEMIKGISKTRPNTPFLDTNITREDAIAWLEKQGEQKIINEVKPKFKVGDYVVGKYISGYISEVRDDCYLLGYQGFSINKQDNYHLWTIQDAKDGDVLSYVTDEEDLWIMIYWSLYEPYDGHVHYHALLVNDNFSDKGTCCICINDLKPATKEQRDILFQKMHKAGYEWDAEKKELKKIEQTPAWSEEDEKTINNICHIIRQYDKISKRENKPCWYIGDCLLWMQNIKDRVQPKQEWNEKDKEMIEALNMYIKQLDVMFSEIKIGDKDVLAKDFRENVQNWLKSLRPQNRWRPSDEQMNALNDVISSRDIKYDVLSELWKDLKKLREG